MYNVMLEILEIPNPMNYTIISQNRRTVGKVKHSTIQQYKNSVTAVSINFSHYHCSVSQGRVRKMRCRTKELHASAEFSTAQGNRTKNQQTDLIK